MKALALAAFSLFACANVPSGTPAAHAGGGGATLAGGAGGLDAAGSSNGEASGGCAGATATAGAAGATQAGATSLPDAGPLNDAGDTEAPLVGPESYFGAAVNPGACLDVLGASKDDGTPLEEWACNTTGAQAFMVVDASGGSVYLVNTPSGKCIAPAGAGTANGTMVQLATCDKSTAQRFKLEDSGKNGLVSIVHSSGQCLDLPNGSAAAGTLVQLYQCNKSAAQLWTRSALDRGYTASCSVAQLQAGSVLAATCQNDAGDAVSSTLHLNRCLTNSNGALTWQNDGGFAGSCTSCTLKNGTALSCQCKDVSAQAKSTSLDLSASINDCNGKLTCGACGAGGGTDSGPTAFSALYGSDGNDFYTFTGNSSIANLKNSGWNALFMFAVSVRSNGDIVAGDRVLAHDGVFSGDPSWGPNVTALKSPPSTVTRYEVTVGGWGDGSFDAIKSLVAAQGTGSSSILYKNFQALKKAVPGIDAINDDDEQTYDLNSSVAFGKLLNGLGMKLTQAPYMNQSFWVQLKNALGAGCDIVYLQVYQGGAGNDPANWNAAYGSGFKVVPGQESNYHGANWFSGWKSSAQISGGFYWPDVTWAPDANWGVFEIAQGVGLPPG